jgi:hypothetical protein
VCLLFVGVLVFLRNKHQLKVLLNMFCLQQIVGGEGWNAHSCTSQGLPRNSLQAVPGDIYSEVHPKVMFGPKVATRSFIELEVADATLEHFALQH